MTSFHLFFWCVRTFKIKMLKIYTRFIHFTRKWKDLIRQYGFRVKDSLFIKGRNVLSPQIHNFLFSIHWADKISWNVCFAVVELVVGDNIFCGRSLKRKTWTEKKKANVFYHTNSRQQRRWRSILCQPAWDAKGLQRPQLPSHTTQTLLNSVIMRVEFPTLSRDYNWSQSFQLQVF